MKFIKSKGKYWYKDNNRKLPFDKCLCGNFKVNKSKMCWKCAGLNEDGTQKLKPDQEKRCKSNGYIFIFDKTHHRADSRGYVLEHIVILEKKIGKKLKDNEVCHHINEIRDDNREDNLMVMTREEHNKHHNPFTKDKSGKYYGKQWSHMLNDCECGGRKDVRSKVCMECWRGKK